jgi:hypothetical protein
MLRSLIVAASLCVLTFPATADADRISFALGMSTDITVPAGERVTLPALLMNTGTEPIDFGCARTACGAPFSFGWGMAARGPDETMEPLHFTFPVTFEQFENVTIPAGGSFSFVYGSIRLDPFTSPQHPFAAFFMGEGADEMMAIHALTIMTGSHLEFGPLGLRTDTRTSDLRHVDCRRRRHRTRAPTHADERA